MNITKTYVLLLVFTIGFSLGVLSQSFTLKLSSGKALENSFLSNIDFKKKHKNAASVALELNSIQKLIKSNGYLLSALDSLILKQKKYVAFFTLNEKIDSVVLKNKNLPKSILKKFNNKTNYLQIPIKEVAPTLEEISKNYENSGHSFSKIKLKNFTIKNKILFAEIDVTFSKKRKINKLIIKGYPNFPNSFIKNFFQIDRESIFNKKKLNEISKLSQNLDFVSEIKPPEILFTKDSTYVYVYLKKNKENSFDGLVNFSTQENGKIQFNGYLDLKLKNTLNTGESLNILWNHFGNEKQELSIALQTPYILNSKLSPEINFSIYKQDSTFLNTKFNAKLQYQIKSNASLFLSLSSENSEKLTNKSTANIETFHNSFLGFGYQYKTLQTDRFRNPTFFLNINPSFGKRKSNNSAFDQLKLESIVSSLVNLDNRNSIYLKNKTGLLNSDSYIENELFRIGGNNSLRGFNEQSVFVKNYLIQSIEYRYLTSVNSFLYSITDFALVSTTNSNEKLLGLGIGYLFNTKNAQINISTAIGTNTKTAINFKNPLFFINWINFF